ncbi:hypothetical protein PBY51_005505 [Eleginops maclovinus]|nr:hypothetical protein PBY51_005505 [Eleginops maclovinus]
MLIFLSAAGVLCASGLASSAFRSNLLPRSADGWTQVRAANKSSAFDLLSCSTVETLSQAASSLTQINF